MSALQSGIDDAMYDRFIEEAQSHLQSIGDLVHAVEQSALDPAVALRCCGMELHSLLSEAALLGRHDLREMAGRLDESLIDHGARVPQEFWPALHDWCAVVVAHLCGGPAAAETPPQLVIERRRDLEQFFGGTGPAPCLTLEVDGHEARLSASAGRRILFIDDSRAVRAAMRAKLSDLGYPVQTASGILEAARCLLDSEAEIVITDVRMPGVEGDEVCRRIKQKIRRVVPVILYSGLAPEQLAERARRASADGYVSKEQGIGALVACMDRVLSEQVLF